MALDKFKGLDEKEIRKVLQLFFGHDEGIMSAELNDDMVIVLLETIEIAVEGSEGIRDVLAAARPPLLDPQKKAKSLLKILKYFRGIQKDSEKIFPPMVNFASGVKIYDMRRAAKID